MPTKLKDLKVTKVDFVDAGANQEANIMLFKSKDGVTPDTPEKEPDTDPKPESTLKRILSAVAKALKFDGSDPTIEELAKSVEAESFADKMNEASRRRITSEIWDVCFALEESLCSVIMDDDILWESKSDEMEQSLSQFAEAMHGFITTWTTGKNTESVIKSDAPITSERIAHAESVRATLDTFIAKGKGQTNTVTETTKSKGEQEEMKIDKSKLTQEELAVLDEIEKKAGIEEETPQAEPGDGQVAKAAGTEPGTTAVTTEGDDIYKGLHPAVKTELENLRKFRETSEDRELQEVAKKYELIGKKPEELVPTLKSLKAAGGDAYEQMITVLDAGVEAFEKSGLFNEVGKRGESGSADPWAMIEKHANEIMKSAPTITRTQAIDKACDQHPELVSEYEQNR